MDKLILLVLVFLLALPWVSKSEDVIEAQTLNIDGVYAQKPLSRADQIALLRKKLEKQNQQLIQNKVETMRYQNELRMMKELQRAMDQQLKALDALEATM